MMLIKTQIGCQRTHMLYGLCCVFRVRTFQAFETEKTNTNFYFFFFGSGTQEKTKDRGKSSTVSLLSPSLK